MLEVLSDFVLYGIYGVILLVLLITLSGVILPIIGFIIKVLEVVLGGLLLIMLFIPARKAAVDMILRLPKHQWLTEKEIWSYGFSPIITTEALSLLRWDGKIMMKEIDPPDGDLESPKEKIYMIPNEIFTNKNGGSYICA